MLVDGGLPIPGIENAEPQAFLEAFLGPTLARLAMRFASLEEYMEFLHAHPAFAGKQIDEDDLAAFARHDLTGEPPELRSTVAERAVRGDAAELHSLGEAADGSRCRRSWSSRRAACRTPRSRCSPSSRPQAWAAAAPSQRSVVFVPDTNHYTIVLGPGARAVAQAILRTAAAPPAGTDRARRLDCDTPRWRPRSGSNGPSAATRTSPPQSQQKRALQVGLDCRHGGRLAPTIVMVGQAH